jgi:glycosyltransferase involved in cell wall biosynthesis
MPESQEQASPRDGDGLRIGFACSWNDPPEPTWSYVPWNLRNALSRRTTVVDLGIHWNPAVRQALRLLALGQRGGAWQAGRVAAALTESLPRRAEERLKPDVVVQVHDVAEFRGPYLLYQDLSFDLLLERYGDSPEGIPHFPGFSVARIQRFAERQRRIFRNAAGVLTMSKWLADHLVDHTGLDRELVHVVRTGINTRGVEHTPPRSVEPSPRPRFLFVGGDFFRKGGDQLVAAFKILRAESYPEAELTIVGPPAWPLPGPVPPGVTYSRAVPASRTGKLYAEHDLFVMPSRFEAFGVAFVDALSHGLPCVGRNTCAMPEIIKHGDNGYLVDSEDPRELCQLMINAVNNRELRSRAVAQAECRRAYYSWDRVANDILSIARRL